MPTLRPGETTGLRDRSMLSSAPHELTSFARPQRLPAGRASEPYARLAHQASCCGGWPARPALNQDDTGGPDYGETLPRGIAGMGGLCRLRQVIRARMVGRHNGCPFIDARRALARAYGRVGDPTRRTRGHPAESSVGQRRRWGRTEARKTPRGRERHTHSPRTAEGQAGRRMRLCRLQLRIVRQRRHVGPRSPLHRGTGRSLSQLRYRHPPPIRYHSLDRNGLSRRPERCPCSSPWRW
jgi:hypothetical protein